VEDGPGAVRSLTDVLLGGPGLVARGVGKVIGRFAPSALLAVPDALPLWEGLRRAAIDTGQAFALPLVLTLLVALFLVVQSRLDERDPKLAWSPLDSQDELAEFE
jgi:hypothetical protein